MQIKVYLTISITGVDEDDKDAIVEVVENALKQPFTDGIVDVVLPHLNKETLSEATIEIDAIHAY
jgi:hypothetical protein